MSQRILVVDDEKDILDLARIFLESGGYDVATATSGEEALRVISEKKPDLVLLDVLLPGVSGLDVCRRLKRTPETRPIKVMLFTALGKEVDVMLVQGDKADGYLAKPFTSKILLNTVGKLLNNSRGGN